MRITITGKNMDVSDYLKDVVNKKLGKLDRYFNEDTDVQVTLSMQRSYHIVEVTIPFHGVVIRAEESTGDMYASIDNVVDKLEKQIIRHRTKFEKRLRAGALNDFVPPEEPEVYGEVVRVKQFSMKPMSVEEAILQIDLLGHAFFVFSNAETNTINVLYRRKDGNYGLIEPS